MYHLPRKQFDVSKEGEIVCFMYPSKLSCNITLYLSPLLPCMITGREKKNDNDYLSETLP